MKIASYSVHAKPVQSKRGSAECFWVRQDCSIYDSVKKCKLFLQFIGLPKTIKSHPLKQMND
ncbi:CLUMA_CG018651, isoform A [Clunio marinus]|uniref:CLUMA_CG018651, isoform A n=1 Tax=Clunio marinus TaxID=568069 RepID=A0A1J1J2C6_9DIPT|nr:CLUMA_CG018651, isoform A [Clunio marinus]